MGSLSDSLPPTNKTKPNISERLRRADPKQTRGRVAGGYGRRGDELI